MVKLPYIPFYLGAEGTRLSDHVQKPLHQLVLLVPEQLVSPLGGAKFALEPG